MKITLAIFSLVMAGIAVSSVPREHLTSLDIGIYAVSTLLTVLAMVLLWLALIAVTLTAYHLRASSEQRDVTYEFAEAGFAVHDAPGASVVCPWSVIRRARETKRAVKLDTKPMGSRYVPKRAFTPDDMAKLRRLLPEKLGTAAKMRKQ